MPSVNLETGATASSPGTPALSPGAPRVVCVLGMHRSGTSLLTRVLNLLGVGLGPEGHLMPADKFNPKGFWEHHGIVNLNDEILETLGGTWRFLPKMPAGWENDARLEDFARLTANYEPPVAVEEYSRIESSPDLKATATKLLKALVRLGE